MSVNLDITPESMRRFQKENSQFIESINKWVREATERLDAPGLLHLQEYLFAELATAGARVRMALTDGGGNA
jgi:hypothetical protein